MDDDIVRMCAFVRGMMGRVNACKHSVCMRFPYLIHSPLLFSYFFGGLVVGLHFNYFSLRAILSAS
jgi:hypothetical protein